MWKGSARNAVMRSRAQRFGPPLRQTGMSLFPAMMFLLVLSVIGVSALNSTLMQEKMVANTKDANLAFQAAEAGLRDAEADIALERGLFQGLLCKNQITTIDQVLDSSACQRGPG